MYMQHLSDNLGALLEASTILSLDLEFSSLKIDPARKDPVGFS